MEQSEINEHLLKKLVKEDIYCESSDVESSLKEVDVNNGNLQTSVQDFSCKRWLMLLLLSLTTMMSALMNVTYSPISKMVVSFYSIDIELVNWMSNLFLLAYILLAIPASFLVERYGLRFTMIFSSVMNAGACCFRMGGLDTTHFVFCFVGQVVGALGYSFILEAPTKLSREWFPPNERALATSVGTTMNISGVALGFLLGTHIVPDTTDMRLLKDGFQALYTVLLVLSLAFLSAVIILFERSDRERDSTFKDHDLKSDLKSFGGSIRDLFVNCKFHLLMQAYLIYFGLLNTFALLLEQIVRSKFTQGHEKGIGWMGFTSNMVSILASAIYGFILDRLKNYRFLAAFLNLMSLFLLMAFVSVLHYSTSFLSLAIIYIVFGAFGIPFCGIGLEHAAVMTAPVPGAISSAVMLVFGNLYGFLMILAFGEGIGNGYVIESLYAMIALYAISTTFAIFTKVEEKSYQ